MEETDTTETTKKPKAKPIVLELTAAEYASVREAVRLKQQTAHEDIGRLDAVLSRVQKKMGDEPGF